MVKPWLILPPLLAHHLGNFFLKYLAPLKKSKIKTWRSFQWKGLEFPNRLGVAAGVDKNAEQMKGWWSLGAGFLEVGTVTPKAQKGNPGKVLDREISSQSLWNHMGFPSKGASFVKRKLSLIPRYKTPIFVNIGKNRNTPIEEASKDYLFLMKELRGLADAFVINVSSPNTPGLRKLLDPSYFRSFLEPILAQKLKPIFVKLSPDMGEEDFEKILQEGDRMGVDGWILTNTTTKRDSQTFPEHGGVSGGPLKELSLKKLERFQRVFKDKKERALVISVGGVSSPEEVLERLEKGADLVQVYSSLIFQGPFFFHQVARFMRRRG